MHCARLRYVVLAFMVATSHVALVSHAFAHFQPALEHCELCVSQAQPQAAVPAAEAVMGEVSAPAGAVPPAPTLRHIPTFNRSHCPRAPPSASS